MQMAGYAVPPQSGMGIASFILSVAAACLIFVLFLVAGFMETSTPGGIDEESQQAVLLGLVIIGALGLEVVAAILGVVALCQQNRRKLFGVLGLLFSGATLLGTIALILIGNTMA